MENPNQITSGFEQRVLDNLSNICVGSIDLKLPDGSFRNYGQPENDTLIVEIHNSNFFEKICTDGDIGLGESYVDGDWDCSDLANLFRILFRNQEQMGAWETPFSWEGYDSAPRNVSIAKAEPNLPDHYELGLGFFQSFLDPDLTYSCALFEGADDTLEAAQARKICSIVEKARIKPHDRVLDLGSGWGSISIVLARDTGCHVTALTLPSDQQEFAVDRIQRMGLQEQIDFQLCDYREATGEFDKIVCVELLEAVGANNYVEFFQLCEKALAPNGILFIQVITVPDQRFDPESVDWIQKHIFPGGLLPSLSALSNAMTNGSHLQIESVENIGPCYGITVRKWYERFEKNIDSVRALGFDQSFIRKWRYYLCLCDAAFSTRELNVLQIVASRPGNQALDDPH